MTKSRKVYTLDGDIKVKVKEQAKLLGNPEMVIKEVAAEKAAAVEAEAAAVEAEAAAEAAADGYLDIGNADAEEAGAADDVETWSSDEDEDEEGAPAPAEGAPAEGAPEDANCVKECTNVNINFKKDRTIENLLGEIKQIVKVKEFLYEKKNTKIEEIFRDLQFSPKTNIGCGLIQKKFYEYITAALI